MPPGSHLILSSLLLLNLTCSPSLASGSLAGWDTAIAPTLTQLALNADSDVKPTSPVAPSDSIVVKKANEDRAWHDSGYAWKGIPLKQPDHAGLKRDVMYFFGYQVLPLGALYLLPESASNWNKRFASYDNPWEKWWENVNDAQMDPDGVFYNYISHPYWGATYYIRGRERGLDRAQSFYFAALLSTIYEYGMESFFEPVSIQDLIITPVLGSLVGEYLFTPIRDHIRAKPGDPTWTDKTVLFLTDPLGVISAWTDKILGVDTRLSVQTIGQAGVLQAPSGEGVGWSHAANLAVKSERVMGIQLEMAW
jgi:hypothetical protein